MSAARRYQLTELLGRGGYGAVYLADVVGTGLQRKVAIKVLDRERGPTTDHVRRLRDEARLLSALEHRAIVRVDDLIELNGEWSVVMEYVAGADLSRLLALGALPPAVATAIVAEVASALHAAWNQVGPGGRPLELVHRDVKPGNIRLTRSGEVKLLDFGIARAAVTREASVTQGVVGTLAYMAPERFIGDDGPAGDVYSMGVLLFELLTGQRPGETAMDPARQVPSEAAQGHTWAWITQLSPTLRALLAAMLAPEPAGRPSAREVARTLDRLRLELPGGALEDWAELTLPRLPPRAPLADARTRTMLVEGAAPVRLRWLGLGVGAVTAGVVALGCTGALAAVVWLGVPGWGSASEVSAAPATTATPPPTSASSPGSPPTSTSSTSSTSSAVVASSEAALAPPGSPATPEEPAPVPSAPPEKVPAAPASPAVPTPAKPPASTAPAKTPAVPPAPAKPPSTASATTPSITPPITPSKDPVAPTGRIRLSGDSPTGTATCGGSTYTVPATVPAGTCEVVARLNNGSDAPPVTVSVPAGGEVVISCAVAFGRCR